MDLAYIFALAALGICLWAFWPDLQDLRARWANKVLDRKLSRMFARQKD